MRKAVSEKFKCLRELPKRAVALGLCFAMLLSLAAMAAPLDAGDSPSVSSSTPYIRRADPSTMDSYVQASLGGYDANGNIVRNDGSRYAGEVWADKSVFANGVADDGSWDGTTLSLDPNTDGLDGAVSLSLDEDFLHVFSVLGSSQQTLGQTPIDLVMVLDMSPSMGNANDPESKVCKSIDAINEAIKTVLGLNARNRVGLIVFSTQVSVMLELGRYTPDADGNYISCRRNGTQNDWAINGSEGYYLAYVDSVCSYEPEYWEKADPTKTGPVNRYFFNDTNDTNGNPTAERGGSWGDSNPHCLGGYTNMDGGFWAGLSMLAEADGMIAEYNDGTKVCHKPALIFLGDGDPNIMMKNGSNTWWDPVDPLGSSRGNGVNAVGGDSTYYDLPAIVLTTIMRATLMREVADRHYQSIAQSNTVDNLEDIQLTLYTVGMELGDKLGSSNRGGYSSEVVTPAQHTAIAEAIMDPASHFYAGAVTEDPAYSVNHAYMGWDKWIKGERWGANYNSHWSGNVTEGGELYYGAHGLGEIHFAKIPEGGVNVKGLNITWEYFVNLMGYQIGEDGSVTGAIKGYTNSYKNATEAAEIPTILRDMIQWIADPAWAPVSDSVENAAGVEGVLSYIDPIGEFMSVGDVKYLSVFGVLYKVAYAGSSAGSSGTRTNYRITGRADGKDWDGKIHNISYTTLSTTDLAVNASDIQIWVEDTGDYKPPDKGEIAPDDGYSEALHIEIPIMAMPVQMLTIWLDVNGGLARISDNLGEPDRSTPLRVYYSVKVEDRIKTNGIVDMSKVSNQYLTRYALPEDDPIRTSDTDGELFRQTFGDEDVYYFLSNYYTPDGVYNGYVVEGTGVSQGNPNITYSVSDRNQFYRFIKNRVMYLIQDESLFQNGERPKDVPLGDLSDVAEETNAAERLLAALNRALGLTGRAERCVMVGAAGANAVAASPDTVNGDNWYYIIREYYENDENGGNDGNDNPTVQYMAIARKGSELGTGTGSSETFGEYAGWYDPAHQNTNDELEPLKNDGGTMGYPNDGNTYYLAVAAGGLRVGGLSNFIGTKGDVIGGKTLSPKLNPEGSDTTDPTDPEPDATDPADPGPDATDPADPEPGEPPDPDPGGEEEQKLGPDYDDNPTNTAKNYYLPTISKDRTSGGDVVVTTYLGNNGRLLVGNTTLLVTKTVAATGQLTQEERSKLEFQYTVTITSSTGEGYTGIHQAIRVVREGNLWRRRVQSVEVLLQDGFLLDSDGKNLAVMDGCYISVGGDSPTVLVFERTSLDDDSDGSTAFGFSDNGKVATGADGATRYFYLKSVTLVSTADGSTVVGTIENLPVAALTGDTKGLTSETEITAYYSIRSQYMTEPIEFFANDDGTTSTSEVFTLHDGEGLVFTGLGSGSQYTVTEILPVAQDGDETGGDAEDPEGEDENGDSGGDDTGAPGGGGAGEDENALLAALDDEGGTEGGDPGDPGDPGGDGDDDEDGDEDDGEQKTETKQPQIFFQKVVHVYDGNNTARDVTSYLGDGKYETGNGLKPSPDNPKISQFEAGGDDTAKYYSVSGTTGAKEEAVHYINYISEVQKVEFWPGDGERVQVGKTITYKVLWENYEVDAMNRQPVPAKVVIRDRLDPGVDFVSATYDPTRESPPPDEDTGDGGDGETTGSAAADESGEDVEPEDTSQSFFWTEENPGSHTNPQALTLNAAANGGNASTGPKLYNYTDEITGSGNYKVSISYDKATHTVTWTIDQAPAGTSGWVTLTVRVNKDAVRDWTYNEDSIDGSYAPAPAPDDDMVYNRADVKVNNYPEVVTEIVENPIIPVLTMPATGGPGVAALLWTGALLVMFGMGLAFLRFRKDRKTVPRRAGFGTAGYPSRDTGPPGPPGPTERRGRFSK